MESILTEVIFGLLIPATVTIWVLIKNKVSTRGIVVLILTAILATILFSVFFAGSTYEKREVCGGCGGSGVFFSKVCSWCRGSGYETETVKENWWCFWLALPVLGVGALFALTDDPNVGKPNKAKSKSILPRIVALIVGIILGYIEIYTSSNSFASAYNGILSPIVGTEIWISGISAAVIWIIVAFACSHIVGKIIKYFEKK